ncbi:MAG: sulfotransferase family protein [bacterium]|nr:sulfotransferase family protein [bacterium]
MTGQMHGAHRDPVVFYHVPKCGGSSVLHVLKQVAAEQERPMFRLCVSTSTPTDFESAESIHERRLEWLRSHLQEGSCAIVAGHFRFRGTAPPGWRQVTVLRNPVDRWLSNYAANSEPGHTHFPVDGSIASMLDTERGARWATTFCDWFSDDGSPEAAIANLRRFTFVGVLESPAHLIDGLNRVVESAIDLPWHNRGRVLPAGAPSATEVRRLYELCAADLLVYRWACRRLDDRMRPPVAG